MHQKRAKKKNKAIEANSHKEGHSRLIQRDQRKLNKMYPMQDVVQQYETIIDLN